MKNSPNNPEGDNLSGTDAQLFGFDGERWMQHASDAVQEPELGRFGPYLLLEECGRGAQGVVYRALQPGTEREIALKRLVAGSLASDSAKRRFEREVATVARLRHPGIVTLYGCEAHDGVPFLTMEWIQGVPITDWAFSSGVPNARQLADPKDVLECFVRVCDAVQHAHEQGVLHRDLKPSNVLVDSDGSPHVLDFGLAKTLDGTRSETKSEGFVGTLAYASPEQLEGGAQRLDTRSDVYSLGVILYELLTGVLPFHPEEGLRSFVLAQSNGELRLPSALRRGLAPDLDAILLKALAWNRNERYPSVSTLCDDVQRFLGGKTVLAHPPSALYELRKLVRRNPVPALLSALVVALIVSFAVWTKLQAVVLAGERDAEREARTRAEVAETLPAEEVQRHEAILGFLLHDMLDNIQPADIHLGVSVGDWLDAALEGLPSRFDGQPRLESIVRGSIGSAYFHLGRFQDALPELEQSYDVARNNGLDLHTGLLAEAGLHLAQGLNQTGREDDADQVYTDLIANFSDERRQTSPMDFSRLLRGQAGQRISSRRYEEGIPLYREGLAFAREHLPDDANEIVGYLDGLAICLALTGDLVGSRVVTEEGYELALAAFGADGEQTATALSWLLWLDKKEGALEVAEARAAEVLRVYRIVFGDDHPRIAAALGDVADFMTKPDQLEAAEAMVREAIDISVRHRGEGSIVPTLHRVRLGEHLQLQGRTDEALELLVPVRARLSTDMGETYRWTQRARQALAETYAAADQFAEAEIEWSATLASFAETEALPSRQVRALRGHFEALRMTGRAEESWPAHEKLVAAVLAGPSSDDELRALFEQGLEFYEGELAAGRSGAFEYRARLLGAQEAQQQQPK